ncbi:surface protease GP63, putative [Trypanosoma cruzi marinkellei]|uniref:Leishmanolysin-like peptidase n=1 Tax=Trypanosoma cruzi marinkellei TaxID=85056 RepID=K2M384_TRYCR|nr:surface protease GP63, putative [Trypanosoma cruzi marinkellei]
MHLRVHDASQVTAVLGESMAVRLHQRVNKGLDDISNCCLAQRSHTMHSLTETRGFNGDVLCSMQGNILAEEVIPAAVKLHADRLLVQPLEGPLVVPPFATGSVCSRFTVPAEHHSTGVADSDTVRHAGGWPSCRWRHEHCPAVSLHGRLATRIAAHLMAHALGFTHPHMAGRSMVRHIAGVRGRTLVGVSKTLFHLSTRTLWPDSRLCAQARCDSCPLFGGPARALQTTSNPFCVGGAVPLPY